MALFLTSDLHLGHRNIARLAGRPFPDTEAGVDEMDEAIVAGWNALVGPEDEVWVLGDVAMGDLAVSLAHVGRLQGTLHLVLGNHDRPWPHPRHGRRPSDAQLAEASARYLDAGFASIQEQTELAHPALTAVTPDHGPVLLHHFPYTGDSHGEDRYVAERPPDDGRFLLHGHVHEAWRQRGRQLNVGLDAWAGRPVPVETFAALISAGPNDLAPIPWRTP